jgi:transposase
LVAVTTVLSISWPLSVLVMDNASIHHGNEVLELADRYGMVSCITAAVLLTYTHTGVKIEYLPPYSPDLNPIEEVFLKIKHFLRRHRDYYNQTTGDGILFDMYEITDIITLEDADGYFIHSGYF